MLRGAGVAIGLPMLEAMRPAMAAAAAKPKRLAVVYVPNGIIMDAWLPQRQENGFQMAQILEPLEPFRQDVTIVTGLTNFAGTRPRVAGMPKRREFPERRAAEVYGRGGCAGGDDV